MYSLIRYFFFKLIIHGIGFWSSIQRHKKSFDLVFFLDFVKKGYQLDLGAAHAFEGDDWMMYSAHCKVTQLDLDITEAFQFGLWKDISIIASQKSYVDLIGFDLNEVGFWAIEF